MNGLLENTKANQEAAVRGAGEMLVLQLETAQMGSGPQTWGSRHPEGPWDRQCWTAMRTGKEPVNDAP